MRNLRITRRRLSVALVLVALSAAVMASTAATRPTGQPRIAIFLSGLTSYTQPSVAHIKKTFAGQVTVDALNANFDAQKMVSQCQDAITTKRYQGFVFYPVDGGSLVPCVKQAIAAGIKVVSWDYPPIGPDPLSEKLQVPGMSGMVLLSLHLDVSAAVTMTRRACAGANPCKVALLVAQPSFGYSSYKRKLTLEKFKSIPSIKVVSQSVIGFDSPDKAQAAIKTALQKDPDLNVVLSDDDSGMPGAERAVKDAGLAGKVKLIGDGSNKYGIQAIRDGRWFGTVVALPKTGGATAVKMLLNAINGAPIPHKVIIDQRQTRACKNAIVDRACAKNFIAEW